MSQVQSSQLISKTYLKVVHRKLICEGMDICEEEAKIFISLVILSLKILNFKIFLLQCFCGTLEFIYTS